MSQRPGSSRLDADVTSKDSTNNSASQNSRTLPSINDSSFAKAPRPAGFSPQHSPKYPPVLQNKSHPRLSRIQDLLNGTASNDNINASHCPSADQLENPVSKNTTRPNLPASLRIQSQSTSLLPSITRPSASPCPRGADQNGRRILTPRVPFSGKGGPLPRPIELPGDMIGATILPFIDSPSTAGYPIQQLPPLSAVAPLAALPHTNPHSTRSVLACSASANLFQVHLKQERRPSDGGPQPSTSLSNSPSTSYSSYSRLSNTPPASYATPASAQSSSFFHPHTEPDPGSSMPRPKASYSPVSSAAGQKYQLMTLNTDQGPVQVSVEVQVASKVADEKRKRNATASQRFRQRKKAKERETSNNIAKLECQIHEEREVNQIYIAYFRDVARSKSGQAHASRPPSTR